MSSPSLSTPKPKKESRLSISSIYHRFNRLRHRESGTIMGHTQINDQHVRFSIGKLRDHEATRGYAPTAEYLVKELVLEFTEVKKALKGADKEDYKLWERELIRKLREKGVETDD